MAEQHRDATRLYLSEDRIVGAAEIVGSEIHFGAPLRP